MLYYTIISGHPHGPREGGRHAPGLHRPHEPAEPQEHPRELPLRQLRRGQVNTI